MDSSPGDRSRTPRRYRSGVYLACAFSLLIGCQTPQPAAQLPPAQLTHAASSPEYTVIFPDILELRVPGHEKWNGRHLIMPDGTIELGEHRLQVDQKTVSQIRMLLAEKSGMPVSDIHCVVAEHRSRRIHISGELADMTTSLPYTGPERIGTILQRWGGITPASDVRSILVVRRNVSLRQQPEQFRIDYQAIREGDSRTNIFIEPNDEIVIGESRRSKFTRSMPIDMSWMTREWGGR